MPFQVTTLLYGPPRDCKRKAEREQVVCVNVALRPIPRRLFSGLIDDPLAYRSPQRRLRSLTTNSAVGFSGTPFDCCLVAELSSTDGLMLRNHSINLIVVVAVGKWKTVQRFPSAASFPRPATPEIAATG